MIRSDENVKAGGKVPPKMRDRYTLRVKEASFGMSNRSNNPMITLSCEIVDPIEKTFDGVTYDLTSLDVRYYLILIEDGGNLSKTLDFMEAVGLPRKIDDENPDIDQFQGNGKDIPPVEFDAILDSREHKPVRRDPEDPKKFVPILDAAGKETTLGWEIVTDLRQVFAKSSNSKRVKNPF